jgi:transcriptional regulator with XRE-family HTH domain
MQTRIKGGKATGSRRTHDARYDSVCAAHARLALEAFVTQHQSQEKAAQVLGLNQGTLSRSLRPNAQPTIRVLLALSLATGRKIDELLGLEQPVREHVARVTRARITDSELTRIAVRVREVGEQSPEEWSHHGDTPPPPEGR